MECGAGVPPASYKAATAVVVSRDSNEDTFAADAQATTLMLRQAERLPHGNLGKEYNERLSIS
jgi:hypothetical protein